MSSSIAQEQQRKYVKRRSESGMKKYLIAVLLTACLLFSFGTTAFADSSGGQESNTDGASGNVTQDNEGHFGYYLSDKNAKWANDQLPADIGEVETYYDGEKVKYRETRAVTKDVTTKVTSAIPTLEGHAFLGWGDKARKNNPAAIRIAGDTLTYCYTEGDAYTLDALWGSLTLAGGSKTYDGTPITLSEATFTLNDNGLKENLSKAYYNLLDYSAAIEYSADGNNWKALNEISFTDVGEYTLYARQKVTLKEKTDYKEVVGQATYTITPRDVTLTSGSATKEYDGTPLTNDTVTAEGKGFVNGEGATYTVTGTQTAVGSSENNFTYTLNSDTKAVNYNITTQCGTLTVTEKTTPDPVDPKTNPDTTPTPTPTPVVTPAPTAAPSTDDTTPENTATPAPTATAAPTATPAPAPTAAPAAARAATTIPQTGDNFPAVALVIVMLAAIVGLGITVVLRTDKKK